MKLWSDTLSAWPVDGPWDVEPALTGGNNVSYPVVTPSARYFLRVYQNTIDPARVLYEHSILTQLQQTGLSFSVPAPIPTHSGSTLLPITDDSHQVLTALFPFIYGQHPDGADLAQYSAVGRALAELDQALSQISLVAPVGISPPFGEFSEIHPDVPDAVEIIEYLPIEPAQRTELTHIVEGLRASTPAMYRVLPRQIVHRDLDASNVLMLGNAVTGVLDFEFAGPDLRALDLARSLASFTGSPWSSPNGWDWVTALASGYRERIELAPGEIQAVPDLMRLYRLWSLIHREGRRRQGLADQEDVLARARALLNADAWLRAHHDKLLAQLCTILE